jgi:3D (Asp-Asp-Asp) domain-containing protein
MNKNIKTSKLCVVGLLAFAGAISFWIHLLGDFHYETAQVKFNNYNYRKMITTAYSEYDSCHYDNCIMANGERAYVGAVACNCLPIGTEIEVAGVKYVVRDRHSKQLECRVDIFFGGGIDAYNKAIQYGKQIKTIKIYK